MSGRVLMGIGVLGLLVFAAGVFVIPSHALQIVGAAIFTGASIAWGRK
jgi:hypothetical protein